jgi:transposase
MTYVQLAIKYNIHRLSVSEWLGYYETDGLNGLNRPIKPMKKNTLDATELKKILVGCGESDALKISALIELAETKNTNQTAANNGITPQGLLKWKRKYLSGELPLTLIL